MTESLLDNDFLIDTLKALWRKRDISGAKSVLLRISDPSVKLLWQVVLEVNEAHLTGNIDKLDMLFDAVSEYPKDDLPIDMQIDFSIVQGKIALEMSDLNLAEDLFYSSLLASRNSDYLLGKVQSLLGLGNVKLFLNQFEQAQDLVLTAASLSENLSSDKKSYVETDVLLLDCLILLSIQDFKALAHRSRQLLHKSIELKEVEKEIHALNHIAIVHASKTENKLAMPLFLEAAQKCRAINFKTLVAKVDSNIATIHGQLHNYNEALKRYEAILTEFGPLIRPEKKAAILNNIGNLYVRTGAFAKAIHYFKRTETIASEKDHLPIKRLAFSQMLRCLVELDKDDEYVRQLPKIESLYKGHAYNGLQIALFAQAKYNLNKERLEEAVNLAQQAQKIAGQNGDEITKLLTLKLIASALEKKGDAQQALEQFKYYASEKKRLNDKREQNRIINTEINYILQAKETEIKSLQRENILKTELLKKSNIIKRKNDDLAKKNDDLNQFAKSVAVHLKEPLHTISEFANLIQHNASKSEFLEQLDYIRQGVNTLDQRLDELFQLATIQYDEEKAQAIDLNKALELVTQEWSHTNNPIQLDAQELPIINGDYALFVMLLSNLLHKLSSMSLAEKGTIHVTAKVIQEHHIIDFFVPMSALDLELAKQEIAHFQASSSLGLSHQVFDWAICQKIVQEHHGEFNLRLGQTVETFIARISLPSHTGD